MKHLLLKLMLLLLLCPAVTYAQDRTITGTVTASEDNQPMPSVTVMVKETNVATQTDLDGKYSIKAPSGSTLVFSFVGYTTREIKLGSSLTVNVSLATDSRQLGEVVVTALGIEKKSKGLTYSTQKVSGDQLTVAKDANMMNSLTGKAAGVQVNRSSAGAGGAVKVTLRGSRSVNGNNDPLYVIDGMPMANYQPNQATTTFGDYNSGNRDGGDGIGNLNPDDIESLQVLKGASAAALYGAQAANGVIIITTKKGRSGMQKVDFSSGFTSETAVSLPELQTAYGQSSEGDINSWGAKTNSASVSPRDFFRNGSTFINSISVMGGTEKAQNYFSYANTSSSGIIPTNSLHKHNFTFRETARLFENKLSLDASVNFINQKVNNRATSGFYNNPFMAVYQYPRGLDINQYKNQYEQYDPTRQVNTQNWFVYEDNTSFSQNPYWILNRMPSNEKLNRALALLSVRWDISNKFNFQVRGSADRSNNAFEQKMYTGTSTTVAGGATDPADGRLTTGRYLYNNSTNTQLYGDVLLNFRSKLAADFDLTASLGSSITDTKIDIDNFDTYTSGLNQANLFTTANVLPGSITTKSNTHAQVQAVYGTAQLSYKDAIFLDLTGRNDWSSTLAFTDAADKGYFYPSAGVTFVLNQLFKMPSSVNLGKVRFSYAKVGNAFPVNVTNFLPTLQTQTGVYNPVVAVPDPDVSLKPEQSTTYEIGTEWRFLDDLLTIDLSAYKGNTINQLLQRPAPVNPYGAANYWINGGNLENKGFEAVIGVTPVKSENYNYTATLNFSLNRTKVIELPNEASRIDLTTAGNNNYISRLTVGGQYGDIYGYDFDRDENGNIKYDPSGLPAKNSEFVLLGNPNPRFMLGFNNSFRYKNINLNLLIDGRWGGKVMSLSQAQLDLFGTSQATADARNQGYVMLEGHKISEVKEFNEDGTVKNTYKGADAVAKYYQSVAGRAGVTSQYMYDATNVRLRELSLGYTFPSSMLNSKIVKSITLSVIGRNLFYISKDAPFDPEASMSTGNGLQGVDVFGLPATRSFGVNAKISF